MNFEKIDLEHWERKEYFEHYRTDTPCTYSMSIKLDITRLRQSGQKVYPSLLYCITTTVNRHAEFRTAINEAGEVGIYREMSPCYTVFHKDSETFSNLWTEYSPNYEDFCTAYQSDIAKYGSQKGFIGKANTPENTFSVSMIPWSSFEGFHLNLKNDFDYLLPIFTMGKYVLENGRTMLPLSVQVHHAVCDGFHLCRFLNELQELLNCFPFNR